MIISQNRLARARMNLPTRSLVKTRRFYLECSGQAWTFRMCWPLALLLIGGSPFAGSATPASALDHVTVKRDGQSQVVSGQVLAEAQDGGLLVQDCAGVLWPVQPQELADRTRDDTPFEFLSSAELQAQLLSQLPSGFRVHTTARYLICYNTSPVYAQWCGALYERLFRAFYNYWEHRGLELKLPPLPLVALVFADQASYENYARRELGDATGSVVGFYSLQTNRVTMHDLTGNRGLQGADRRLTSTAQINSLLAQPGAERMVATIVHEATHQITFNCGLHARYADIPLWVSEGLAVFFETPDLRSSQGWRGIGGVQAGRLAQFRRYRTARPEDSLRTLVADDSRFRQTSTAPDAYAEAWALHHFLVSTRLKDYVRYQQQLSAKPGQVFDSPEERLAAFREAFGDDLASLDAEFLRYVSSVLETGRPR